MQSNCKDGAPHPSHNCALKEVARRPSCPDAPLMLPPAMTNDSKGTAHWLMGPERMEHQLYIAVEPTRSPNSGRLSAGIATALVGAQPSQPVGESTARYPSHRLSISLRIAYKYEPSQLHPTPAQQGKRNAGLAHNRLDCELSLIRQSLNRPSQSVLVRPTGYYRNNQSGYHSPDRLQPIQSHCSSPDYWITKSLMIGRWCD